MRKRRIDIIRGGSILGDLEVETIGIVVEEVNGILVPIVTDRFSTKRFLLEGLLVQFILLLRILLGGVLVFEGNENCYCSKQKMRKGCETMQKEDNANINRANDTG